MINLRTRFPLYYGGDQYDIAVEVAGDSPMACLAELREMLDNLDRLDEEERGPGIGISLVEERGPEMENVTLPAEPGVTVLERPNPHGIPF